MIQTGAATGGVRLNDVVVTAVGAADNPAARGFYVADAAQAAASAGVFVFTGSSTPVTVTVGQIVDITGTVSEFDFQPPGDTVTQLTNVTVTPVAGSPVTVMPLDGVPLSTLNQIGSAGEPYEGVLVRVTNVSVMSTATGDRVTLTDGTNQLVMDDDLYDYARATYDTTPATCFSSVTGIMTVNIFDDQRRLTPRTVSDIVTAACP
jgi:predicted extracellular nuclease